MDIRVIETKSDKIFATSEWGTFKDSLRSPIHNWFPYPAGFSNKAVEYAIKKYSLTKNDLIYDPFTGTATTNIVSKSLGIPSVGVEAHPFIYFVASTKAYWKIRTRDILVKLEEIENRARKIQNFQFGIEEKLPELVYKCFSENVLLMLCSIREAIIAAKLPRTEKNFFNLALACVLRPVANVGTGWPYIAPNKIKNGNGDKNVYREFQEMVLKMCADIHTVRNEQNINTKCLIINGDARDSSQHIDNAAVDLIFTSPPYLNNYDYADRTRLETYFFEWVKDWGEITKKIRNKLMMSATTQINRGDYVSEDMLIDDLKSKAPQVARDLQNKISKLSEIRLEKGGKKSYDILVGQYFNDMFLTLKDCFRVLKKDSHFILILGDSAPYGIHIPTEEVLGELGKAIGYRGYTIELLRRRGEKWKANPQRHSVALKEVILDLVK